MDTIQTELIEILINVPSVLIIPAMMLLAISFYYTVRVFSVLCSYVNYKSKGL